MGSRMSLSSPEQVVEFLSGSGLAPLRDFLVRQRWFAAKARGLRTVEIEDWAALEADRPALLLLLRLDGERYYVPLSVCPAASSAPVTRVARVGDQAIVDAHGDLTFMRPLLGAMAAHRELEGRRGSFECRSCGPVGSAEGWGGGLRDAVRISGEQSNTSVVLDRTLILKSIRRPRRESIPMLRS